MHRQGCAAGPIRACVPVAYAMVYYCANNSDLSSPLFWNFLPANAVVDAVPNALIQCVYRDDADADAMTQLPGFSKEGQSRQGKGYSRARARNCRRGYGYPTWHDGCNVLDDELVKKEQLCAQRKASLAARNVQFQKAIKLRKLSCRNKNAIKLFVI